MTNTPEKMSGTSLDIAADNRARLKELFPTVFTETLNDKGELTESMDFERLKAELGTFTDLFENRRERYGMDWPGKNEALRLIQTVSHATLKPCREESVNFDTTENLFIEGDNLEVLKLLQKSYYGKVKMIYIDPPYNTGNEFIYPDNYAETLDTYLEYAGLVDGEGKKFSTNTASEGRFHTKWLNMIYPRLYLARNLLLDDGVIFISIDDNEVSNLRKLCDEIFGEENFLGQLVWHSKKGGGGGVKTIVAEHEYIVAYSKLNPEASVGRQTVEAQPLNLTDEKGPYRKGRELNKWGAGSARADRPTMYFPIIGPNGEDVYPIRNDGSEGRWRLGKPAMLRIVTDGDALFEKRDNGTYIVFEKIRSADPRQKAYRTILNDGGTAADGTAALKELFGGKSPFDFPKPIRLLSKLIDIAGVYEDDIVLDFFSGSATIAHAVLDLNNQDGGNRKFILVQLPELCVEDSEAFKAGYKNIADIGKERIRRVISKLVTDQIGKLPLADDASSQDRGFKVLKLDKSNFQQWQPLPPDSPPEKVVEQLKLFVNHIEPKASPEDLLYEILVKAGFPPSEPIATQTLAGKTVYAVSDGGLLLCLEETVTPELINAVVEANPQQFICLDAAFGGNDQLKANAVQTFAAHNLGKEKYNQIVFRTV